MFVNRERELGLLEERYRSGRAELFVLYGRRRVGKTELLRTFCQGKRHVFYVADLGTETASLAQFTRQIGGHIFGPGAALSPFASWEAAFGFLASQTADGRLVVVVDEFTYLVDANDALPSILQRLWDTQLQHTQLMLILCGSYVGMMEQHVLAYRAPLYGRRTGQWQLQPLDFWTLGAFLPDYRAEDLVRSFAVLGGVPAYLRQIDDDRPLLDNIADAILAQGRFLHDEPRFLLLQELRDPNRYFSVLEAVASGRTRMNAIAQRAGIAVSSLSFYLNTLREMGLVERAVPATETQPHKSKRGIYRLRDHFFRFWFRFVYPNRSLLERGEVDQVRARVEAELDQFVGPVFERICQEYIWRIHTTEYPGLAPRAVGSWWDGQEEIDIVAVGKDRVLVGECKWTTKPVGINVLHGLRARAERLAFPERPTQTGYALFSRSGFTDALRIQARKEEVLLVDLEELMAG